LAYPNQLVFEPVVPLVWSGDYCSYADVLRLLQEFDQT